MQSAEIARRFLAYFEAQGHTIVPSANLVADDPTLLFVVAGMQPFKPYLLGQRVPPWKRVADVQKCVRTLDIEEVGKTTRSASWRLTAALTRSESPVASRSSIAPRSPVLLRHEPGPHIGYYCFSDRSSPRCRHHSPSRAAGRSGLGGNGSR